MRVLHVGHGFVPLHHGGLINYAESLMDAQAGAGHRVAYFFSGRRYPLMRRARVYRWRRGAVEMIELLNSPVPASYADTGTADPATELAAPPAERLFSKALDRVRPEVVHVHDLVGLPSSLLEIPGSFGIPVVMALRDYYTLCPTLKLFDAEDQNCLRRDPAPMCVRCCSDAIPGVPMERQRTRRYHRARLNAAFPLAERIPGPGRLRAAMRGRGEDVVAADAPTSPMSSVDAVDRAPIHDYRARRDTNVTRLNGVDRMLALSPRVAEIYELLGVEAGRIEVLPVGPAHLAGIAPREPRARPAPLRAVSLNGGASVEKGAGVLADAAERLQAAGFTAEQITLTVIGEVHPAYAARFAAAPLIRSVPRYARGSLDVVLEEYDIGLMPSTWEEAMGFAGVEMLAKGLPVIGNAMGGIVEYVVDGETGWVNPSSDGAGLAAIVEQILADPAQVAALSRRVLDARAQLIRPASTWLDEVDRVYADVIGQRRAQSSSTAVSDG